MQKTSHSRCFLAKAIKEMQLRSVYLTLQFLFRTGNQVNLLTAVHFFTVTRFPQYDKIRTVRAWRALLTFN